jgi:hypothetical protein
VSAIEGESALTERVQCQRGNERLQGSEGVRAVRSRSHGGNQTGKDERLWVALTGGLGARARSGTRGPSRSIKIRRGGGGGSDRGKRGHHGELNGGEEATNPRAERGERRWEDLGRAGATLVSDSGHGEGT